MEDDQLIRTKLLTLLNVSASRKRKRIVNDDTAASESPAQQRPKLNQRKSRSVQWTTDDSATPSKRIETNEDVNSVSQAKLVDLGEERRSCFSNGF